MKQKTSLPHRYLQVLLAVLCILFAYFSWTGTKPMALSNEAMSYIDDQTDDDTELVFPGIGNTIPEMDEFDEMVSRPLFMENRQPYVFVEEAVNEPEVDPRKKTTQKSRNEYSLNAVIITPEKKIAIIEPKKGKELQRVALGDMIDDWKLEEVESREIKLTRGNETQTLVLEIKNSSPTKTTEQRNQRRQNPAGNENPDIQDEPHIKEIGKPEDNETKEETSEKKNNQ